MSDGLSQFTIAERSTGYWRVTFSNPPVNMIDPDTILELQRLLDLIEADHTLRVFVFDSEQPDFFFNRYDVSRAAETPVAPGPTGLPTFIDITTRLSHTPVVSIALARGRTRGGGAELALACDLRFASKEKASFGQPEVGAGVLPGGGGIERLPGLVGRARALEIILGANDFDAETAERYGWINRALPDDELDTFVDDLAARLASFDARALTEAKRLVNRHGLPAAADLIETQAVFLDAFAWPSARARSIRMRDAATKVGPDFELRLGHHLGHLDPDTDPA